MAEAGPLAVAEEARQRGLSSVEVLYIVRGACGVSVKTAKEVLFQVEPELNEFYEQLLEDLDAVHAEMDRENDASSS